MSIERKSALASVMSTASGFDEAPNGSFDVLLSTPTLDRDGDRLLPDEWQLPLPKWITFDIDHLMSVAGTIGSGLPFLTPEGNLRVLGHFASTELAQNTRRLVVEGHIRSVSVTFLAKTVQGRTTRELLNGAFVAVPANPEARVLASKSHGGGPSSAQVRAALADARGLTGPRDSTGKALAAAQRTIVRGIAAQARRL